MRKSNQIRSSAVLSLCMLTMFGEAPAAGAQLEQEVQISRQAAMDLAGLERMALEKNPTLAQAAAAVKTFRARATQAGLYPNPTVGVSSEEVSFGPIIRGGEQGVFVRQNIILGEKLGLRRQVFEEEAKRAEAEAQAQRQRVLNTVRVLFYQGLALQRKVELRQAMAELYVHAVGTTRQLTNVGQADLPDLLEIEIEQLQAEHAVVEARNELARLWTELASVAGDDSMTPVALAGSLEEPPVVEIDVALRNILTNSPELKAAQAGAVRAGVAVREARSVRIPDIELRGGVHYNRERLEANQRPIGWQASFEIGLQLPLFNRNQGGIQAAQADLESAGREIERVRLALRARLAPVYRDYLNLRDLAARYREGMIPRARRAFESYEAGYRQMAAAYPQVLIAQRTMLQLQEKYDETLVSLWKSALAIEGLLLEGGLNAPCVFCRGGL